MRRKAVRYNKSVCVCCVRVCVVCVCCVPVCVCECVLVCACVYVCECVQASVGGRQGVRVRERSKEDS